MSANTTAPALRSRFLTLCLEQLGKPYIWASKGPASFDCSGLVTWSLLKAGGPDWRGFHNAQRLWTELPETFDPQPGDLAFYGRTDHSSHVMVRVGAFGLIVGASGGNSDTTTPTPGASVKIRASHTYRPDFLGWRSLSQHLSV
jgi:murein DD-endopeptidase